MAKAPIGVAKKTASLSRDKKIENLIVNHSLIFMGMFEEAFADIAEKMTEAMSAGASAVAGALGGSKASSEVGENLKEVPPRVRMEIDTVFSDMREEMASQWPKNPEVFKKYISNPGFDKGVRIVESYDFGRPRLTEELTDEMLASYIFLIKSGDEKVARMFKELSDWQASLPQPPWRS